jgi:hypothetical protein
VLLFYKKKNFVAKKIVRERYVSAGPLPSALPIPLLALWSFASGHAGACRAAIVPALACRMLAPAWPCMPAVMLWVIWVIWVTVLNCMAMHALGHLGHCFLGDPNDPKGADLAPGEFPVFGSFGSFGHRFKIGGRRRVNVPLQSY